MGLYHHFQTAMTFATKQSNITLKKNLIKIILFRTYEHLKLYILLLIFHVLTTFYIYQAIYFLINSILYPRNFGNFSNITVKIE